MIITQTPLRISLLGGNTDFPKYFKKYGGAVLTTTIDKYIYCIISKRFDDQIWINYSKKEIVDKVSDIKHDLVREAMKLVGVDKGVEITFLSDIPSEGSGLGSSSAVLVGVLNALHNFKGESVTARQLAGEACQIEVNILKRPIGYQDQYAVAFGGLNLINFNREGIKLQKVSTTWENSLMVFYTGKTRNTNKILMDMKLNKKILDKNSFLVIQSLMTNISKFGLLLGQYWALKKELNPKVTNKLINDMYRKAMAAGAEGGKIIGAGGGGFMLLVVQDDKKESVRSVLNSFRELPFNIVSHGSRVIFNNE